MIPVRKFIFFMLLGLLVIFVQGTVLRAVLPEYVAVPNLVLVLAVFLAFYEPDPLGALMSFLLGLLLDLGSSVPIGPWAGSFVIVYGILACFAQQLFVESIPAIAVMGLLASVVSNICHMILSLQFTELGAGGAVLRILVCDGLLSAIAAPLIFSVAKLVFNRADYRRNRSMSLRLF